MVPRNLYDAHHPSASAIGCHGGRLPDNMRKVISVHKADQEDGFPLFLLHYKVSTDKGNRQNGLQGAAFRRELHLPCNLLQGALPMK
jgi:hypothetical protein